VLIDDCYSSQEGLGDAVGSGKQDGYSTNSIQGERGTEVPHHGEASAGLSIVTPPGTQRQPRGCTRW